jgi:DNA-directed RNA polymerase III subunit RPC1
MKYIQEVIVDEDTFLRIKIDLEAIRKLHLELDIDCVKWALIRAKLKINETVTVDNVAYKG